MNTEQYIFDGLSLLQLQVKPDDLMDELDRRDLKLSVFSTSQNRIVTYFFGNEEARDTAVARWRKHGVEIIGYKEKEIMSLDEAICESADYISMRITILQKEDQEMTERYDRLPDFVVTRQRQIVLEVKRLQNIHKVLIEHIHQKVADDTGTKDKASA